MNYGVELGFCPHLAVSSNFQCMFSSVRGCHVKLCVRTPPMLGVIKCHIFRNNHQFFMFLYAFAFLLLF